jgi:hypothetical protein
MKVTIALNQTSRGKRIARQFTGVTLDENSSPLVDPDIASKI